MTYFKNASLTLCCVILVSCGVVGDYYVFEGRVQTTLFKDDNIFVHLHHFDGDIGRLTIYKQSTDESLKFRIVEVSQSLLVDNIKILSETRNDTKGIQKANPESSVLLKLTEIYKPEKPFERVVENVSIKLFINEREIEISKDFPLRRVTYNQLQALYGI